MSWGQGIQSAIHFYLSCAPCFQDARQRKRRNQAKRDGQELSAYEMRNPTYVRQARPFETNPNWSEEIAMGPGPPNKTKKGKKARNASQRSLTSAATNSTVGPDPNSSREFNGQGKQSRKSEQSVSGGHTGNRWNILRYQREDEDLWGVDMPITDPRRGPVRQGSNVGTSLGIPGVARGDSPYNASEGHYYARNPPVNKMLPPVVSSLMTHGHDTTWLKQPPPPPRVMEGKEPASRNRSRSGSGTSSRRERDRSLGRTIGAKVIEEKYRKGKMHESPSPMSSRSLNGALQGQRHDKDLAARARPLISTESTTGRQRLAALDTSEESTSTVVKKKMSSEDTPSPSDSGISGMQPQTSHNVRSEDISSPHTSPSRFPDIPPYKTTSRDFAVPRLDPSPISEDPIPQLTQSRSAVMVKDDSLSILQELVSPNALLNSRFIRSPPLEARIRLPAPDEAEEMELQGPWLDSRFPGGDVKWRFGGGEENEQPGRRDPRIRWSFDL